MNLLRRIIMAAMALSLAGMLCMPVAWSEQDDYERARELAGQEKILPLARIMQLVSQHYPGKVLDVELEEEKGLIVYELKVLADDGVLRKVEIDARSGDILKAKVKH